MRAGEILALLEDLSGPQAELRQHVEALTGCSEAWAQWPSPGPLADAVLVTSIAYTLDPTSCAAVQVELRRHDPLYANIQSLKEMPQALIDRIRHYFLTYKDFPGRKQKVEIGAVYERDEALEVVTAAIKDYDSKFKGV